MATYIEYIQDAFRERIEASQWMDKPTKTEALAKLNAFTAKIGYPAHWRDFSTIEIRADDLLGNNRRIIDWQFGDALAKLGQPRRAWEWELNPQEVNAYYAPPRKEFEARTQMLVEQYNVRRARTPK